MVLVLAVLGTSCNKNKETTKKMVGTWNLSHVSYRDTLNQSWTDTLADIGDLSIKLNSDGTYTTYNNGVEEMTGRWEYYDEYVHFHGFSTNLTFKVDNCTKSSMEWFTRNESWHETHLTYWREELWTWRK